MFSPVIVKASSGPRYVVSYRPALPLSKVCITEIPCVGAWYWSADRSPNRLAIIAQARSPSISRYDNLDHHAHSSTGS